MSKRRRLVAALVVALGAVLPFTRVPLTVDALIDEGSASRGPAARVVLVSIDGLRADDLDTLARQTAVAAMLEEGIAAQAEPHWPTLTVPMHVTLLTGVVPATHGVTHNLRAEPRDDGRWFGTADDVRVPTLHDVAVDAGMRTAAFWWPGTGGTERVALLLGPPEPDLETAGTLASLWRRSSLWMALDAIPSLASLPSGDQAAVDGYSVNLACRAVDALAATLVTVHLAELDVARHTHGMGSQQAQAALMRVDEHVARLQSCLPPDTALVLVGDHGHGPVERQIRLNAWLAERGWLEHDGARVTSWRARAVGENGYAEIHVRSAGDVAAVHAELSAYAALAEPGIDRVLRTDSQPELPRAAPIVVAAAPGFTFGPEPVGPVVLSIEGIEPAPPHGLSTHGHAPEHAEMWTALVAAGPGIAPGARPSRVRLIDVAPSVAALLGLSLPGAEGRVIAGFSGP